MAKRKAETGKQKRSAKVAPEIRDRIRELRRVKAADLVPHPKNMQIHGDEQRAATEGILRELGYADALIVRELADGTLQILDGHLRADITPDYEVPVLLVDLDDAEADLFLATHDPLARMAEIDPILQMELLRAAEPDDAEARHLIDEMLLAISRDAEADPDAGDSRAAGDGGPQEIELVPHEHYDYVIVLARNVHEWNRLCELLGLRFTTRGRGSFMRKGVGRGVNASKLIGLLEDGNVQADSSEPTAGRKRKKDASAPA